jgi:cell wall assembly regulator SMI1
MADTAKLLEQLDEDLATKLVSVATTLRPPATKAQLGKLAKLFGGKLPGDVRTWFAWHDGQHEKETAALIPDTNWSALSIARIHAVLSAPDADIMKPWSKDWIPMFENGAGDHLRWDLGSGPVAVHFRTRVCPTLVHAGSRRHRGPRRVPGEV